MFPGIDGLCNTCVAHKGKEKETLVCHYFQTCLMKNDFVRNKVFKGLWWDLKWKVFSYIKYE